MYPLSDKQKGSWVGLSLALLATLCIIGVGWHTGLFWDNILFINTFGTSLYENGIFAWGSIPIETDPGHPMLTASYITAVWKLFGRSIEVTHLALIPFIFLFLVVLWHICQVLFDSIKWAVAAFILIISDPSVFSQLMYIGPEVFVLCFSGIAIYGVLKSSKIYQTLGLLFLGITSLRGMMLCAGIFLWDLLRHRKVNIYVYIIGAMPAVVFLTWRLITKGWIISNPTAAWGSAFGYENVMDFLHNFLRNGIVLASRILDFGRIVPALIVFVLLIIKRKAWIRDKRIIDLLLFTSLICIVVACTSLLIVNPMGHSYFLWIYIGILLLLIALLQDLPWRKVLYGCSLCALLVGNAIIYPDRIAQGWSCSLASLPYWSLREQMFAYMEEEHIVPQQTLTFFPWGSCADDVDLKGDKRPYALSWEEAEYVMASNVCNLDDETLDRLQRCTPIKRLEKRGVYITLFRITP